MAQVFDKVARPAILAASRSNGLRRTAERMPVTRRVVDRFVPGETVDQVLKAVATLRDSGRFVTVDYLGEENGSLVLLADVAGHDSREYLFLLSCSPE